LYPPGAACLSRLPAIPPARLVILTTNGSPDLFLRAIHSGVQGYLLKDAHPSQVVLAVRAAASGGVLLDPRLAPYLLRTFQRAPLPGPAIPPPDRGTGDLPARDRAILCLVAAGYTNKEIGLHLYLAEKTVRNRLHRLFERLHFTSRAEAAAFAVQQRLTLAHRDLSDQSEPETAAGPRASRESVPRAGPGSIDLSAAGQLGVK
jgi:two-component system response regulator DevR